MNNTAPTRGWCKDCTHHEHAPGQEVEHVCTHPHLRHPVTGERVNASCIEERSSAGACRPMGINFERRTGA